MFGTIKTFNWFSAEISILYCKPVLQLHYNTLYFMINFESKNVSYVLQGRSSWTKNGDCGFHRRKSQTCMRQLVSHFSHFFLGFSFSFLIPSFLSLSLSFPLGKSKTYTCQLVSYSYFWAFYFSLLIASFLSLIFLFMYLLKTSLPFALCCKETIFSLPTYQGKSYFCKKMIFSTFFFSIYKRTGRIEETFRVFVFSD